MVVEAENQKTEALRNSGPDSDQPIRLENAGWLTATETQTVFAALNQNGHEARVVGGAVRNTLMGLPVSDVDIACTATPDQVVAMVEAAGLKAIATGLGHGTITVVVDHHPFEVTTLRQDVETFGRHATVRFTRDWSQDARRRDFTMNALYASADGLVYDPLGGLGDIFAQRVRFIGDARERIREDYLRILRFFRFNADYGAGPLDEEGVLACVRERKGLRELSAERVHTEMFRLLVAPAALRSLQSMYDSGLLLEVLGTPARLALFERLASLEAALGLSPNPVRRLCALTVATPEDAERLSARLKLSRAESRLLDAMSRSDCPQWRWPEAGERRGGVAELANDPDDTNARLALYRLGRETFEARVLDVWTRLGAAPDNQRWRQLFTVPERWTPPEFPLKGADLMEIGVKRGPQLGEMLRRLEIRWAKGGFHAGKADLLEAEKA